ncbi:hypothetical protein KP79_PYT18809 [Mizuhopecten yessoensis]|uniref:Uncharacterized protein n=1 Tax=Mizuhopecten yessoensis TaxID=6573 RepID=A0A210Q3D1_MIZYE|nr:hypothetical protein KP79_PYT18809 [Mizuhopecten yessoensis]
MHRVEECVSQEEYLGTNFHCHYLRKLADFEEPFTSALPEVRELGLELVSVKTTKHYPRHTTFDIVNKERRRDDKRNNSQNQSTQKLHRISLIQPRGNNVSLSAMNIENIIIGSICYISAN